MSGKAKAWDDKNYFDIVCKKYAAVMGSIRASQMLEVLGKVEFGDGWTDAIIDLGNRLELFRNKCLEIEASCQT